MRVEGTIGDIIGLLGTIHWPLEHIYTRDKILTSNLQIFLFFGHFWSQMTVNDGPRGDLWGHEGTGYHG